MPGFVSKENERNDDDAARRRWSASLLATRFFSLVLGYGAHDFFLSKHSEFRNLGEGKWLGVCEGDPLIKGYQVSLPLKFEKLLISNLLGVLVDGVADFSQASLG